MAEDDAEKVWKLMDEIDFCMLTTHEGEKLRARPMSAHVVQDEDAIYFLADEHGLKDDEIEQNPNVCLSFSNGSKFVSLTGAAFVSDDRAKIKELWDSDAKAWWDSPDDPGIRVIKIEPEEAQYWDSPGKLVATVAMATAAVTGGRPKVGKSGKVDL